MVGDVRYEHHHNMNTVGHPHHRASELRAVRSVRASTIVTGLAGALVLAAVMGLNLDAVPELPTKVVLGVSLVVFYGAAFGAIRRPPQPNPAVRRPDPDPDDWIPATDTNDVQRPSEDELVRAWRRTRLTTLGVPEDVALALAEDQSFSPHDLERLLAQGCPLGTALRILQPA